MKFLSVYLILIISVMACQKTRDPIPTKGTGSASAVPVIKIAGFPQKYSRENKIELVLAGSNISGFKFKVTDTLANPCTEEYQYGPEFPMSSVLNLDLSELDDGEISFCIVGKSSSGVWQKFSNPTSATWIKKTLGPDPLDNLESLEGINRFKLSWTVKPDTQYLVFRSLASLDLPLLEDGHIYEIGDVVNEDGLTLVYKGNNNSFVDDALIQNESYFYYIYVADILGNYSLPYQESLPTFGTPYAWLSSGLASSMYRGAIQGGNQADANGLNVPTFICRADFGSGQKVPGQLETGSNLGDGVCRSVAFVNGGLETSPQQNYEILVSTRKKFDAYFTWSNIIYNQANPQQIPAQAIVAGTENNAPLFICRGSFANRFYPGKIGTGYDRCSAPAYNGTAYDFPAFESWQVLTILSRDSVVE